MYNIHVTQKESPSEQIPSTERGWGGFVHTLTAPFRRRFGETVGTIDTPAPTLPEKSPERTVPVEVTISTRKMTDVDEVGNSLSDDVRMTAAADNDYFRVIFLSIPSGASATLWIPSNDLTTNDMHEAMDRDWPIPNLCQRGRDFHPEMWHQVGPRWDDEYTGTEEWALSCDEHGRIKLPEYLEKYRVA